jgi:hypothetical protein
LQHIQRSDTVFILFSSLSTCVAFLVPVKLFVVGLDKLDTVARTTHQLYDPKFGSDLGSSLIGRLHTQLHVDQFAILLGKDEMRSLGAAHQLGSLQYKGG